jgi:N-acyl-D-aspartate/D-glutamate deacylase
MVLTASKLREDIYRVLDHVLATGEPVEIERNGRRLRIVANEPPAKLARLVSRPEVVSGDSDDFIHLDWSDEWSG